MDEAARKALGHLIRTELASDLDRIAGELEELRLRVNVLEAQNGIPTGLPRGARARQREVVRLRAEGYSLRRIAATLAIARGTVEGDLARARAVTPSPDGIAADGRTLGRRANGRRARA